MTKITEHEWNCCHDGDCKCGMIWDSNLDIPIATVLSNEDIKYTLGEGLRTDSEEYKEIAKLIANAPVLLKELKQSNNLLKRKQKLSCNCSIEKGKCDLCKQIENNKNLIWEIEGDINER